MEGLETNPEEAAASSGDPEPNADAWALLPHRSDDDNDITEQEQEAESLSLSHEEDVQVASFADIISEQLLGNMFQPPDDDDTSSASSAEENVSAAAANDNDNDNDDASTGMGEGAEDNNTSQEVYDGEEESTDAHVMDESIAGRRVPLLAKRMTRKTAASAGTIVDNFLEKHDLWAIYVRVLAWLEDNDDPSQTIEIHGREVQPLDFVRKCLENEEREAVLSAKVEDGLQSKGKEREKSSGNNIDDVVDLGDAEFNVKLQQFQQSGSPDLKSNEEQGGQKQPSNETNNAAVSDEVMILNKLSKALLRPGMKYRGHIFVPGLIGTLAPNEEDRTENDDVDMNDAPTDGPDGQAHEELGANDDSSSDNAGSPSFHSSGLQASGSAQNLGKEYELTVIEQGKDALGNAFILATHMAYEDEQAVHIRMNIKDVNTESLNGSKETLRLEIEYADGETVCKGSFNLDQCRFEGRVYQMLEVNDDVFHTSDAATHVFTLYPCTQIFPKGRGGMDTATCLAKLHKAEPNNQFPQPLISRFEKDLLSRETTILSAHRRRTHDTLVQCLRIYHELFKLMNFNASDLRELNLYYSHDIDTAAIRDLLSEKQQFLLKLHGSCWPAMNKESNMHGERFCAELRRRASLLSGLSFETPEERSEVIERWGRDKMGMFGSHGEWFEVGQIMQDVGIGSFIFDSSESSYRSAFIRHRLLSNFGCFERAFQKARVRLPKGDLAKYEIPRSQLFQDPDSVCIICQSPLLGSDDDDIEVKDLSPVYRLPCSHCFHGQCVRQWLHDHSSCPVCRFGLEEKQAVKLAK